MTGTDGTQWDVVNGTESLTLAEDGLSGILFPKFDNQRVDLVQGTRFTGTRLTGVEVSATLVVGDSAWSDGLIERLGHPRRGVEFMELDASVRRALTPGEIVRFTAQVEGRARRVLDVRLEDLDTDMPMAPDKTGFVAHDVEFVSDGPLWRSGRASTFDYAPVGDEQLNYYGGQAGAGTPLFLGGSGASAASALRNGGDLPAWPTWSVTGPIRATITVAGKAIETKLLAPGETVVIDTAPWSRSVTVDGVSAWNRLVSRGFAAVPTGDNPQVEIVARDIGPGGGVRAELFEQYLGAW